MWVHELETAPIELVEDTILAAIFTIPTKPPPDPCERAMRHHNSQTIEGEDARARKKERTDLEFRG